MSGRRVLLAVVVLGSLAAAALVAPAAASAATSSGVLFSPDGTTFSSSYDGKLFGDTALVPSSSVTRSFWVENGSAQAAYLRIAVGGVSSTDDAFLDALTLSVSTPGWPGQSVHVTQASPCYVLSEGQVLPSGAQLLVNVTGALDALAGSAGQNGSAGFELLVSLSSASTVVIPPTACVQNAGVIPVGTSTEPSGAAFTAQLAKETVTYPTGGTSTWKGGTICFGNSGGVAYVVNCGIAETAKPGSSTEATPTNWVVPNTDRLFQEYDVAFWMFAAVIGMLLAWLSSRRRDRAEGGLAR